MPEILYEGEAIERALDRMASAIKAPQVYLVGIQTGGAAVADAIEERLRKAGCNVARGNLDISFYRDDLDTIAPNPVVHPSAIPFDLNDKTIWLIDDVLYTGRTVRAALGELFDYGRPACIRLAVLLDRGGRELPIAADVVGIRHPVPRGMSVKLVCDPKTWRIVLRRVIQ